MANPLKTSSEVEKFNLREYLKNIRADLCFERRNEAEKKANLFLEELTHSCKNVLSFANFASEIDISSFNQSMMAQRKLCLPKLEGRKLRIFRVKSFDQLALSKYAILEPLEYMCEEISPFDLDMVIVPGLGFDRKGYRLGYGKGVYDRFLREIPSLVRVGIGFEEQLVEDLPITQFDVALKAVHLF